MTIPAPQARAEDTAEGPCATLVFKDLFFKYVHQVRKSDRAMAKEEERATNGKESPYWGES